MMPWCVPYGKGSFLDILPPSSQEKLKALGPPSRGTAGNGHGRVERPGAAGTACIDKNRQGLKQSFQRMFKRSVCMGEGGYGGRPGCGCFWPRAGLRPERVPAAHPGDLPQGQSNVLRCTITWEQGEAYGRAAPCPRRGPASKPRNMDLDEAAPRISNSRQRPGHAVAHAGPGETSWHGALMAREMAETKPMLPGSWNAPYCPGGTPARSSARSSARDRSLLVGVRPEHRRTMHNNIFARPLWPVLLPNWLRQRA
jgi:hypothetical protein